MPVYDLAIIGGGSAGLTAARVAVALGARVALVERSPASLGGDCLHTGCVPSKALIHAARAHWEAGRTARWGLPTREATAAVDLGAVLAGVREVQGAAGMVDTPEALGALGIALVYGDARFRSPALLEVAERPLHARRYLIATGSRPAIPPIAGLDTVPYLTNETLFALTALPSSLLVVGGGPVGCELGQALARLGARMTIVTRATRLLPKDDAAASATLRRAFETEGIAVITGARVEQLTRADGAIVAQVRQDETVREHRATTLLVAAGRQIDTASLDLAAAGVVTTARGIAVDEHARTANPRIYAAGDVIGQRFFTHVAGYQASVAVANALLPARMRLDYHTIPWTTFTSPEVARIGFNEDEARAHGHKATSTRFDYRENDRALTARAAAGNYLTLVHDARGTILGAQIVGPSAGETINEVAIAMKHRLSLAQFSAASHAYPTLGMGLQQAALAWRAESRLARGGRVFLRPIFRWQRRRLARELAAHGD